MPPSSFRAIAVRLMLCVLALALAACEMQPTRDDARDGNLVKSTSWLMVADRDATPEQVAALPGWQSFSGWKSFGFGPEAAWVRIRLAGMPGPHDEPWILVVQPPFVDHLTVHDPHFGRVMVSGDAVPPRDDALSSRYFTFRLPPLDVERDVYIRLESSSSRIIALEVLPLSAAVGSNRLQDWLFGFTLAVAFVLTIWAVAQLRHTNDPVLRAFAPEQIIATTWAFFYFGYARPILGPWLPPGTFTAIAAFINPLFLSIWSWFWAAFLSEYGIARHWLQGLKVISGLAFGLALIQLIGYTRLSLQITNLILLLSMFWLFGCSIAAARSDRPTAIPGRHIAVYTLLYAITGCFAPSVYLGLLPIAKLVPAGLISHAMMDGLVVFIAVQIRARQMERNAQEYALQVAHSRELADAEKQHRREQSDLYAMLAHEVKTLLSTLSMQMQTGGPRERKIESTLRELNQMIERGVHAAQISDRPPKADPEDLDATALTRRSIALCRDPDRIEFSADDAALPLRADVQMTSVILANLIDNACKYGAPELPVRMALSESSAGDRPGCRWQITNAIGDMGVPDERMLFQKFYRNAHARRQSGAGLGLYLSRELVELMDGHIEYRSDGNEVCFTVWLPRTPTVRPAIVTSTAA